MKVSNYFKLAFLSFIVFLLLIVNVSNAQTGSSPLTAEMVVNDLSHSNLTPKQAYQGIDSLENMLHGSAFTGRQDQILYNIAKYKIYLGYMHKDSSYVRKNPRDYVYFEPGNIYIYKGHELKTIIHQYPASPIADDAAYLLSTLPKNDCEGDISCSLNSWITSYSDFLQTFGTSPYVYDALNDINQQLEYSLIQRNSFVDSQDKFKINNLLDQYFQILSDIPSRDKVFGLHAVAKSYVKLGEFSKAKNLYKLILFKFPDYNKMDQVKFEYKQMMGRPDFKDIHKKGAVI